MTVADATAQILADLVAFDTTSERSNLVLAHWIRDYLEVHGVNARLLPDVSGAKATLVARIGPERPGGVVLCGHTDVVPVTGQTWSSDPFVLTQRGTRLHGRGTADMKGFIASALAAVPMLVERPLTVPVTLALTYDEEIGALGADELATALASTEPTPALVLVGEPTSMTVARAHKGVRLLQTTVRTRAEHASRTDRAPSAIAAAARLIHRIEQLGSGAGSPRVAGHFEPAHTTTNVGLVSGGSAVNIVAAECTFTWEYRTVPGDPLERVARELERFAQDEVLPDLRITCPDADIVTSLLADVPALDPAKNGEAAALLGHLGLAMADRAVSFGTDGSALQSRGLPTVVCGPGSMDQGHQPDEFIEIEQLRQCDAVLASIAGYARDPSRSLGGNHG
jgi:acetylornithine deacetylase